MIGMAIKEQRCGHPGQLRAHAYRGTRRRAGRPPPPRRPAASPAVAGVSLHAANSVWCCGASARNVPRALVCRTFTASERSVISRPYMAMRTSPRAAAARARGAACRHVAAAASGRRRGKPGAKATASHPSCTHSSSSTAVCHTLACIFWLAGRRRSRPGPVYCTNLHPRTIKYA